MKKWLTILIAAAALFLYPFAAGAADYGSQPSQDQKAPPVAQTLVREGDFAIKLAAELDLGKPSDEATAEDMLTAAGVVPVNGWLSDYPMTPEIIGQLRDAVSKTAAEGKLKMNNEEAVKGLYYLTAQMNLPTPAGAATGAEAQQGEGSGQAPAAPSNPSVVNNYYYDQGPPVVTYYPPPYDYGYMYSWVPYPVWWFGFWFPGFFICNDFTTVIVSPVFFDRRIISNHVIDPVTRRVAIVDPVSRSGGSIRSTTVLRTAGGRTFGSLPEMRRSMGSVVARADSGNVTGRGFSSRDSQKGAESIYRRSMDRAHSAPALRSGSQNGRYRSYGSTGGRSMGEGQRYSGPSQRMERSTPRMPERSYNNSGERFNGGYGGHSWQGGDRSYSAPRVPTRSFSTPMIRGGAGSHVPANILRGKLNRL
jgi:hypothetical protein